MAKENENHALERLRERYFADADQADLAEIKSLVRDASKRVKGLPFEDCKTVFVVYRKRYIAAVYVPKHDIIRTVLPCRATSP